MRSRWTLALIAQVCDELRIRSLSGLSRLLKRLGIRYKRGRRSLHSPDPAYESKRYHVDMRRLRAKYAPDRFVLLYLDEFTYYRQPRLARAYAGQGKQQYKASLSHRQDTQRRVIGALNAVTGETLSSQHYKITVPVLSAFYARLAQHYAHAETIYVVLDNWPVHYHPDALARLAPQAFYDWFRTPGNWPTQPGPRAIQDELPIQLVPLPTYAPWLNPIEKLWLWLYQDVLYLHRFADDWQGLKTYVQHFLESFSSSSPGLLRYVGLLPD